MFPGKTGYDTSGLPDTGPGPDDLPSIPTLHNARASSPSPASSLTSLTSEQGSDSALFPRRDPVQGIML